MKGFALYRMPYARDYTFVSGPVHEYASPALLNGSEGFVLAPFVATPQAPVVLVEPEVTGHLLSSDRYPQSLDPVRALLAAVQLPAVMSQKASSSRADYHIDFLNFHAQLREGVFQKLVLSRTQEMPMSSAIGADVLFERACRLYPRMFIALVYTPQSGLWLTATPETLLSGDGSRWQTMALAGTMAWSEQAAWSDKNLQEQRYVATYITRLLEQFTSDFSEEGPYTTRAGHLAHLRSDFRFTLLNNARVGELIQALHPTPAVCGLPKTEALRFILANEHSQRSYYSGFMGPFAVDAQTHLFVTLRCMQVFQDGYRLYAGGGLLKDSVEEQEWQETETKMDTMRRVLETE